MIVFIIAFLNQHKNTLLSAISMLTMSEVVSIMYLVTLLRGLRFAFQLKCFKTISINVAIFNSVLIF